MHLLRQHMVLFFLLTKTVVVKSQHPLMTVQWPVWNGLGGLSPVSYMSTKKKITFFLHSSLTWHCGLQEARGVLRLISSVLLSD